MGLLSLTPRSTHQWLRPLYDWLDILAETVNVLFGISFAPVRVMTAGALPAYTYVGGSTQTITANANGSINTAGIDGVEDLDVGDRIWLANPATGADGGAYEIVQLGDAETPFILLRTSDANASGDFTQGKRIIVREGSTNGGYWELTNASFTLDTTTPTIAQENVVTTNDAQTITGLKSFVHLMIAILNSGGTFATKLTSLATATRTFTFPDLDMTPAQSGVASGSTAPAFTGTAPTTAVAAALLAGTGLTAVGQVVTTTDNKTVTTNQYAGCWLLGASSPPCKIVSHPAATGAPVIFTVKGLASTDAGAYEVLGAPTPAGTVAGHTHSQT